MSTFGGGGARATDKVKEPPCGPRGRSKPLGNVGTWPNESSCRGSFWTVGLRTREETSAFAATSAEGFWLCVTCLFCGPGVPRSPLMMCAGGSNLPFLATFFSSILDLSL